MSEWDKDVPESTDDWVSFPADNQSNLDSLDRLLSQYPKGIILSYSSATTVVASTGGIVCSNAAGTIRKFRNNTATTNITFADIDIGAEAGTTTYWVYAVGDAVATTVTFKVSLSSTLPDAGAATYYKRIGSFYNDSSSDIEYITNDNARVITSTGTIANAATISLPSGYSEEECDWIVSGRAVKGYGVDAAGSADDQYQAWASDARVVTCQTTNTGAGTTANTCTYFIMCLR